MSHITEKAVSHDDERGPKRRPNLALRMGLVIFIASMFLFPGQVYSHFYGHFTGLIGTRMITGQWEVVILNVLFFVTFLVPLSYRKKASWGKHGLVAAFFVSLFIEMYGIPFTVLFVSNVVHPSPLVEMHNALVVNFLGVSFAFTLPMLYGTLMMAVGTAIIVIGWITLYKKGKEGELVTTGIYSVSRHPQYLGFLLVIVGWMIGWPTVITLIFGAILVVMYVRVCLKEEEELLGEHDYAAYRERVPFLI
ncbi:MAG: DUF1295 domain-containing protein [Candidatus Methanofastidiosa archaeon]|nr:DUF1295 domain-containing protein [Candidatus Methanofastidiosa archaeon]